MSDISEDISASAFSYELPAERIAQRPVEPYDEAKLLMLCGEAAKIGDHRFRELPQILRKGDLLLFNNSKVIPARLSGRLVGSGGAAELLIVERENESHWFCLGKPLRKFKPGTELAFTSRKNGSEELCCKVIERREQGVIVEFLKEGFDYDLLDQFGVMPIPPYIRSGVSDEKDKSDYQTHFAKNAGSIAAPTASLHFTPELMQQLKLAGIETAFLTLHVGMASFLPLWTEDATVLSRPSKERYRFDAELLQRVRQAKSEGRRVITVGTTVVRAIESMMLEGSTSPGQAAWRETDLFISPGFTFQAVDGLITNFHQPRTSHLLLVQALTGSKGLEQAYAHALANEYRFLSYGDGMLYLPNESVLQR